MSFIKRFVFLLIVATVLSFTAAQAQRPQVSTVNVTPEEGRVRVAGLGGVFDLKLEVVNEAGDTVFEGTQVTDQRLDWAMTDSLGKRVAPGTYTVTVSYTTPNGKLRKRIEQVLVTEEVTSVNDAEKIGAQKTSASAPNPTPLVDGAGTANKIPKYVDADTLTSSAIMDVSGRIGIGTAAAPAAGLRLEVNGITKMTPGGSGGFMQFGTPNTETGLTWSKGSGSTGSRADIRFDGTKLTLAAGVGIGVPSNTGIVVNKSGSVGIGTTTPGSKLHVVGGITTSNNAPLNTGYVNSAIYALSPNIAVAGSSPNNGVGVFGISYSGIGVRGVTTNGFAGFFDGKVQVNGTFVNNSDRAAKANITSVNPRSILYKLATVPIQSWNYKAESASVRHVGPMAQDFRAAFQLGLDDKTISAVDADGVALASIQALYQLMLEKDRQIERLEARLNQVSRALKRKRVARR